jgi:hypothetical protein
VTVWATFAALTTAQMALLDGNFSALAQMGVVPCGMSGSSTLTLVPSLGASGPPVTAYADYQAFIAIANATNIGSVLLRVSGLGALAVYRDTPAGPVTLTGGEIVQLNACLFVYDSLLNASAGGFHLISGGAFSKAAATTVSASTGATIPASAITGNSLGQGVVVRAGSPSSAFTDTLDTGAAIASAVAGGQTAGVTGAVFRMKYVNTTSETVTISGGTSTTILGINSIPGPGSADYVGIVTNGGTAVELYR